MKHKQSKAHAFTLMELLMVIAIIGILAGILFPTVGLVSEKARIATSKARISQYLAAIQSFKGEYSYYPFSTELDGDGALDLSIAANSQIFIETLSARELSNPAASVAEGGNRRRIQFYTFSEDEIAQNEIIVDDEALTESTIVDGFGNNQIFIVFDHDNDGEVTVPDPAGGSSDTINIRSQLTAYVKEDSAENFPAYYLYE